MTKELEKSLEVLRRQMPYLQQTYHVKELGVFGSFARGDFTGKSDIDILVEFEDHAKIGFVRFISLEEHLSEALQRKIDLVTKDALKPIIKEKILQNTVYV
jgi:predicted nucleotidyltransferase